MGRLTTHVLDIASGRPAAGMAITLRNIDKNVVIGEFRTNDDGRLDAPALQGDAFVAGRYELVFAVGDYFRALGVTGEGLNFLEEVPLRFGVTDPSQHYHVPLLVSPWAFSTYRGS
jgi:5-hydroxyisourate hydrolase